MTLPDVDSLATLGGALNDYSPVIDVTTDRAAAAANQAYADTAAMTHTAPRAWARMTLNGSAAPALVAHDEHWNNTFNAAPTFARTAGGTYTVTQPATIIDEIPAGLPGYNAAGHLLHLRFAWANDRGGATLYTAKAVPTSANVVTVYFFVFVISIGTWTLQDPGGAVDVDVFMG